MVELYLILVLIVALVISFVAIGVLIYFFFPILKQFLVAIFEEFHEWLN